MAGAAAPNKSKSLPISLDHSAETFFNGMAVDVLSDIQAQVRRLKRLAFATGIPPIDEILKREQSDLTHYIIGPKQLIDCE
jgi:hypothetical protein